MTILRCTRLGLLAAVLALSSTLLTAQGRRDDYDRAEKFLAEQIRNLAYEEQSNYTLAPNLKGRLFLAHGDVDENVPLPATIKLVDALVRANKDFDFLIMPNRAHGFGNDPYFVRRRWDYFVKHLIGIDPPTGFKIGDTRTTSTSQPDAGR